VIWCYYYCYYFSYFLFPFSVVIPCTYMSKLANVMLCEASQCLHIFRQGACHELCDDREGNGGSEEEENKVEPKPVPSFDKAECIPNSETVLLHTHNIGERDE
jgi:hypothetical protein